MSIYKDIIQNTDVFTDPRSAREMSRGIAKRFQEGAQYEREQVAEIKSVPMPVSMRDLAGLMPSSDDGYRSSQIRDAKVFKVRFLQQANKRSAASDAIPGTKSLSLSNDIMTTRNKLTNLVECVAFGENATGIKIGDLIDVQTYPSDLDADVPSMQFCKMISLKESKLEFADGAGKSAAQRDYDFLMKGVDTDLSELLLSAGEYSNADIGAGTRKTKLTWEQCLAVSKSAFMKELGKYISSGEGGYDSVYGYSRSSGRVWTHPTTGKRITQMTIAEVAEAQKIILRQNGNSSAVGAYQYVMDTFQSTREYHQKMNPTMVIDDLIFNAETQEAFSMRLFFEKRPVLGSYILGIHDNHTKAAQQMAYEWASVPLQETFTMNREGCRRTNYRGQSAYEGCWNNRVDKNKTPEQAVAVLMSVRNKAQEFSITKQILDDNNLTATPAAVAVSVAKAEKEEDDIDALIALGMIDPEDIEDHSL